MAADDYMVENSFEASEDELSQDSLDLILERNLIMIPAAQINDMKLRRVDGHKRTNKFNPQTIIDEINQVNRELEDRSPNSREATPEEFKMNQFFVNEQIYFSIDKVENFEVYFPQNNIMKMIGEFEKKREEQIASSPMKALVLKSFMGNRRAFPSVQRGRKSLKTLDDDMMNFGGRLKTRMRNAMEYKEPESQNRLTSVGEMLYKEREREKEKEKEKEKSAERYKTMNQYNLKIASPHNASSESGSEEDMATLPKAMARNMERRATNINQYMNKMHSLYSIKMSSKILSQNNLGVPDGSSNRVATPKAPATSASEFSTFKDFSSYQRIELPSHKPIGMSSHKISSITSNTGRLFS
jgi:hypothetical protein